MLGYYEFFLNAIDSIDRNIFSIDLYSYENRKDEAMGSWNGLDFFIFLIFFANIVLGMSRGASKEIVSLMCLSVGVIFTIKFAIPMTNFLNSSPSIQSVLKTQIIQNFMYEVGAGPLTEDMLRELSYSLSIIICFVGAFSACEAMLSFVGFAEVFGFPYATLTRKVGAGLGATRGYVFTLLLIIVLTHLFKNNPITGSYFMNLFQNTANKFDNLIGRQEVERYHEIYKDKNLYNEQEIFKTLKQETSPF